MQSPFSLARFWAVCLGNLFEHYDTALYGFLSPFLAPLFFPMQDPLTALILTYAMLPLGMLARPFGALFFGKMGDLQGRERALAFSLFGMALVSLGVALCPNYFQIGILAPIALCIARILQNFLGAGELMGGAIFLLEHSPKEKHDFLSSLYSASTIGGILIASALVFLATHAGSIQQNWRLLYLFGTITALFGCFFRMKLPKETSKPFSFPLPETLSTLWKMKRAIGIIALTSGFSYATYSMGLILMNGFIPLITPFTKETMLSLNTLLLLIDFAALPLFGRVASKVGREKLMLYAALLGTVAALPLSLSLVSAGLETIILIRLSFVILGVAFCAPYHAFTQQLVPSSSRYLVLSFGYALGSQVLGGTTSVISLTLFKATGAISSILWYWTLLAAATTLCLAVLMKPSTAQKA